jgi:hypothetical protein
LSDQPVPRAEHRYDPSFFRSVGELWRPRLAAWLAGAALAAAALGALHQARVIPDELGVEGWASVETFRDRRINAWHLAEYDRVYPASAADGNGAGGLWLGNSQLHAVNQLSDGDHTAPHFATERLGWPMYALSLPNASLQEHLVVLHWALERWQPSVLVLPLVYDDLRESGLRREFRSIASPDLIRRLESSSELGKLLAAELKGITAEQTDFQGPTRDSSEPEQSPQTVAGFVRAAALGEISLQTVSEAALEQRLSGVWELWAHRPDMYATLLIEAMKLRNWVFGITARSKRPMIPARYERNMEALSEILRTASDAGVAVVLYVVPLRQDIEPPYYVDQYREWKRDVANLAESAGSGIHYVDLDALVPGELWGVFSDDEVDFMHFRGAGHRILGERIADLVTGVVGTSS